MTTLNAAIAILISSGLDLSLYLGIVELPGYRIEPSCKVIDHSVTEYDMGITIWKTEGEAIVAEISNMGHFQLLEK